MANQPIFKITLLKWREHNPTAKKHFKKTMIEHRLISDAKINALPLSHKWLFINLLLICGEHANDTVTLTQRQVNDILTTKEGAINALARLQSFQLISYEKMALIEEKRSEKNRIEEKAIAPVPAAPPSDPFFRQRFDSRKLPAAALIWNKNCAPLTPIVQTTRNWNTRAELLVEDYGEPAVLAAVKSVASNSFLTGQNKRNWKATFAWFINQDNFGKVLAGDYDTENGVSSMLAALEKELAS